MLGIVEIFVNGLVNEFAETVLVVGYVHGLVLAEAVVAAAHGWLLFVLFDAATVDWGDGKVVICEVIVAFL